MDKESLIAYISKLNDRNLNRQQASGFTIWAILGILAFLVLDLSEKIPSVYYSIELKFYSIIILAMITDFLPLVFFIYSILILNSTIFGKRRFSSTVESKSEMLTLIPFCFVLIVFSIINLEAASLVTTLNISPWVFQVFALYFGINGISPIIKKAYQFRKSLKAKTYYPEISWFSIKTRTIFSIVFTIMAIISSFLLYLIIRDITISLEAAEISLIIKTDIEILAILILILFLFNVINSSNRFDWLENLEREIYIDDLSEIEIKEKLEREYIGYDIFKWLSKREEILNKKVNEILTLLEDGKQKLDEIEKIDPKYQFEIVGKTDEIFTKLKRKSDEYRSLVKQILFQVTEITKQGIPEEEEINEIKTISEMWLKQVENIEMKTNALIINSRQILSKIEK